MNKRFKLEILYDDTSFQVKYFSSRKEAETFARMEGDHVWQYKIKDTHE